MSVLAKDVMQKEVKSVPPDMSLPELERRLSVDAVSGFAVIEGGRLLGVVTAIDVIRHLSETGGEGDESSHQQACVRDIMTTDLVEVGPDATLHEIAALMTERCIHRVLITENQQLVGVITSLDVARICGRKNFDITFQPPPTLDF